MEFILVGNFVSFEGLDEDLDTGYIDLHFHGLVDLCNYRALLGHNNRDSQERCFCANDFYHNH